MWGQAILQTQRVFGLKYAHRNVSCPMIHNFESLPNKGNTSLLNPNFVSLATNQRKKEDPRWSKDFDAAAYTPKC